MTLEEKNTERLNLKRRYLKTSKSPSSDAYLIDLFKYMNEKNYGGFSIYKANDDLSQWNRQVFNPATNIITPMPCN